VPSSTSTLCGCEQTRNPLFIAARLLHLNTSPSPSDRVQAYGPHISKKQDDTTLSRQDGLIAIPRGGREALAGEWPDVSDFVSAFPKLLIYSLDSAPREAEEVYLEPSPTHGEADARSRRADPAPWRLRLGHVEDWPREQDNHPEV
jgi:hypothetical protein